MHSKKCFKCGEVKSIDLFYKHNQMLDGHLNKCIDCTKIDVSVRFSRLSLDKEFIKKERKRGRDKYYRLEYKDKYIGKKGSCVEYYKKYPEKKRAKHLCQRVDCKKGMNNHHWSYNVGHEKDVIQLDSSFHYKCHRYMAYDQERMMYRDVNGVLIDSREKAIFYYDSLRILD
jgi:hypothetical protein